MKGEVYSVSSSVAGSQSPIYSGTPGEGSSTKKRVGCLKLLLVFVAILLLAVIGLIIALVIIKQKNDNTAAATTDKDTSQGERQVCLTAECTFAASELLGSIDSEVDPCEDFYQYACGSWRRKNVIAEEYSGNDNFLVVWEKTLVIKKYLLEDEKSYPDFPAIQKAKSLYKSCINQELLETIGHQAMVELLTELDGWPIMSSNPGGNWNASAFDLVDLLVKLNLNNFSPILNIFVTTDVRNSSQKIIYLDQPPLILPSRNYYLQPELTHVKDAYARFIIDVAVAMGADRTQAEADVADIVQLETDIANISMRSEDRRDDTELYNKFPMNQLRSNFTEASPNDPIQFSLSDFITGLFSSVEVNVTLPSDEPIVVMSTPYLEKMFSVLQKYDKRTITNYVLVHPVLKRITAMSGIYMDMYQEFRKVLTGATTMPPRWKYCMQDVSNYFPLSMSHMFILETFQASAKTEMMEMIDGLMESFEELIKAADWMDIETKANALEKSAAIKRNIGFSDEVLNKTFINEYYKKFDIAEDAYLWNRVKIFREIVIESLVKLREPVNKNQWLMDMSEVNAYYSQTSNAIYFPAGILQPPYYGKGRPKAMNYGGIGYVIGHEITHGFDDGGRQYDKDGNLAMWWTDDVLLKFRNKTQCIIDQYSNYLVPEAGINLNGINTQGENIADNGGIRESYMAYRKWVQRHGREEDSLPGVSLTPDQIFFVSTAQVWCSNIRKESAIVRINSGVHSLNQFRVIGTLQNMPEFSQAFQCGNNTYMNPAKKCRVW